MNSPVKGIDVKKMSRRSREVVVLLKQLAHPERLMLLCHMSAGEKNVGELEAVCNASQSQVSQFLGRLKSDGLVSSRREGNHVYYRIVDPSVLELIQSLQKIYCK